MTDDTLDNIAQEIGTVTEEQEDDGDGEDSPAREGEEFDVEEFQRNKDDYDGDW